MLRAVVLLSALAALHPSRADACSPEPECPSLFPRAATVPANLPAVRFRCGDELCDLPIVRDESGAEVRLVPRGLGDDRTYDLVPPGGFVAGTSLRFFAPGGELCGDLETSVEFGAEAPPPAAAGTLSVARSEVTTLQLETASGACVSEERVSTVRFAVELDPSLEPWRAVTRTHVAAGARAFDGPVYSLCPPPLDDGVTDDGIEPGAYDAVLVVNVLGFPTLRSEPLRFRLPACDEVASEPERRPATATESPCAAASGAPWLALLVLALTRSSARAGSPRGSWPRSARSRG